MQNDHQYTVEHALHFIGGSWEEGGDRRRDVVSPSTGKTIGSIPLGSASEIDRAVAAAQSAKEVLRTSSRQDRADYLRRVASVIEERRVALSRILTAEQGKPISQAEGEVLASAGALRLCADTIMTIAAAMPPLADPMKRAFIELRPRGVYGIITPWNFPVMLPCAYYLGPGMAAGNAFVWVPAPTTSLAAHALVQCFQDADPIAPGMINLVLGNGPEVGDALVTHNGIDALAFTGSTATGEIISSRVGLKHLSMELGGNGPTIVFNDADLQRAAECSTTAAFLNAGQICTATERVLVQQDVYDQYLELARKQVDAVRLGDPFDPTTTLGPLHSEATAQKVDAHIGSAVEAGAEIVVGGSRADHFPTNLFYQPTIISHVPVDSELHCEETFGPVLPVLPFKDDEELRTLIKKSDYGLFGSVFTASISQAMRCAGFLDVGVVNVNEMSAYWEPGMPAGGASGTKSGSGRIGIGPSIMDMSDQVTVTMDVS